jgi:predicted type IV restriction endonuclease
MNNGRLWLCVDSTIKKLTSANHWVTSIDPYKKDLEAAIENLKIVKNMLEEENESENKKTSSKSNNS